MERELAHHGGRPDVDVLLRRQVRRLAAAFALLLAPAAAAPQDFDYYLLALTWTPSWCAAEGDEEAEQCDPSRELGFTLHGLWPQHEAGGWPEFCDAPSGHDPSRRQTAAMADVMGSGGLAWYQWKKHGRCSGLAAADYFALAREAFEALALPRSAPPRTNAAAVEEAFLAANGALSPEGLVVTCRAGRIEEVRLCLTKDLAPRACGPDVLGDACRARGPLEMPPVR
jgi:ribonuclease T2